MIFSIDGKSMDIDILTFQQVVAKTNGTFEQVLAAIVEFVKSLGFNCTTSAAWQLREAIEKLSDSAKLRTLHHAEIGYWFSVDPFSLTELERVGLKANLDRVQCQEKIFRSDYDPANMQGVYDLFKSAYDNEDLAQEMKSRAARIFMEKQTEKR